MSNKDIVQEHFKKAPISFSLEGINDPYLYLVHASNQDVQFRQAEQKLNNSDHSVIQLGRDGDIDDQNCSEDGLNDEASFLYLIFYYIDDIGILNAIIYFNRNQRKDNTK